MTSLRDDGYLETDCPVVAACFLRREVLMRRLGTQLQHETELAAVSDDGVQNWKGAEHCYPILIPAATVAEVCGFRDSMIGNTTHGILCLFTQPADEAKSQIMAWLRTPVKEE